MNFEVTDQHTGFGGFLKESMEFDVEPLYRDAPLMSVGEGICSMRRGFGMGDRSTGR